MPAWNKEYFKSLEDRFDKITDGLSDRLDGVIDGSVAPAVQDIKIGSAKKMSAAILFFDIRDFTSRTGSSELEKLKETLIMLDCVIPMVMHVIYDHNGIIEKNTGDGIMAIVGLEEDDEIAARNALSAATIIFYVLNNIINPYLTKLGIKKVDARIGIDIGTVLVARIGTNTGTSKHDRNFLTIVGPTANIASKIQNQAGTNQIWVGDKIRYFAEEYRQPWFKDVTPSDWGWVYTPSNDEYKVWHFNAWRLDP